MGIIKFAAAAGIGAAAVKIDERVKARNPGGKHGVDDYINETKLFAAEVTEAALGYVPQLKDKAAYAAEKLKDTAAVWKKK